MRKMTDAPLLAGHAVPAGRRSTGGWHAARFIIWAEAAERFVHAAIFSNLISFLTGPLREPTADAAAAVNAAACTARVAMFAGGLVADRWLGRHRTILLSSILYIAGLGLLAAAAAAAEAAFFYGALFAVVIVQGGHRPCMQALGADQFGDDEAAARSSFFNWWNFAVCSGFTGGRLVMSYVQDNVGWVAGFGVPCAVLAASLAVFLLGGSSYRCSDPAKERAAAATREDFAVIFRLVPLWATMLTYAVCYAQLATTFTKAAAAVDRRVPPGLVVPPAALQSLVSLTAIVLSPLYGRIVSPFARWRRDGGDAVTTLERIGAGMLLGAAAMAVAALVEMRRLNVVASPETAAPMRLWWIVPQYVIFGVADVFANVGMLEFFYEEAPQSLRSLGIALSFGVLAGGDLLSGLLVVVVDRATSAGGGRSWFAGNLDHGHLDYFYALLAVVAALGFLLFIHLADKFVTNDKTQYQLRI